LGFLYLFNKEKVILNIETASTNCSVSLAQGGEILALKEFNSAAYSHSEQLHLFIEEVLKEASVSKSSIKAIAVSKGPGSYTGLRIGVSAAKGLCYALELPLISISTLEAMAHQIKMENEGVIISLLDARRDEVYMSVYNQEYQCISPTEAKIIDPDSFKRFERKSNIHFVGPGAAKCAEIAPIKQAEYHLEAVPSAREMAALSQEKYAKGQFEDVAYFEPFYLKDFVLQKKKA
jgi:tRNA threonylcarbamoyladenosine biosynthesis protein TsaB